MKLLIKGISLLLTMVLIVSTIATPVAAGRRNGRGQERQSEQQIYYLDAEVRVINGQPVIMFETDGGNVAYVSVQLPRTVLVDGQIVPLVLRNDSVVVPAEDGPIVIPISEFHVLMVNGQVVLVADENPLVFLAVLGAAAAGGIAGVTGGAAAAGVFTTSAKIIKLVAAIAGVAGAVGAGAAAHIQYAPTPPQAP